MRKARIFLILGTWAAVLPYLGFPSAWKETFFTLTGLVIIFLSYLLYKENKGEEKEERTFDNFRENNNFREQQQEEANENTEEITEEEQI